MSTEEDKELRDLVLQTLQKKGVINKVQAEIRASVFLALEENDVFKEKSPFLNQQFKEYVKTTEGALAVSLVKEFLEFFNLQFTSSVFDPETHAGTDYAYEGRSALAKQLSLSEGDGDTSVPLLSRLVPTVKRQRNPCGEEHHALDDFLRNKENIRPVVADGAKTANGVLPHQQNKQAAKEKEDLDAPKLNNAFHPQPNNPDAPRNEKSSNPGSGLSSLGGLPPLGGKGKGLSGDKGRDVANELKEILDFGLGGETQYEEDFVTSISDKGKKPTRSRSGSEGSEIEEEISSPSNDSPQADELTVDVPVSKASGHGDYLEDV